MVAPGCASKTVPNACEEPKQRPQVHKVFAEEGESRDNHRYAVVVQDLATQWIQTSPCKTKSSLDTEKSLSKLLEPSHRPKVVYPDNSLNISSIRDKWRRPSTRVFVCCRSDGVFVESNPDVVAEMASCRFGDGGGAHCACSVGRVERRGGRV